MMDMFKSVCRWVGYHREDDSFVDYRASCHCRWLDLLLLAAFPPLPKCHTHTHFIRTHGIRQRREGETSKTLSAVSSSRGVHPPWGHDAFFPAVSYFPPIFEKFLDFLENLWNFPFPQKKSHFHPPKFLTTFFLVIDHKFRNFEFPPCFACFTAFPPDSRKFLISPLFSKISPLFSKISPLFSKNSTAIYILYVYFSLPTLTMMRLCITQCTYWTPLDLGLYRIWSYYLSCNFFIITVKYSFWVWTRNSPRKYAHAHRYPRTAVLQEIGLHCVTKIQQSMSLILYIVSYERGITKGPSIKYVTLEGGRGSEKVWQFVTGGGGRAHVTSCL